MNFFGRKPKTSNGPRRLWLDLGDLGDLGKPAGPHEQWQDHGLGLPRPLPHQARRDLALAPLRAILHNAGAKTTRAPTRACTSWDQVRKKLAGYDMLIMNVRSYTFPVAYRAAKLFKEINPNGLVLAGGMHATVALDEMTAVPEFDKICQGPGENIIVDLVSNPQAFERVTVGVGAKSMAEWPMIDRTLGPKP